MTKREIVSLETQITRVRKRLAGIGAMRPGSISKQYRDRKNRKGLYYQLSYTHQMKSRTEHVWPEHVKQLEKELAEYTSRLYIFGKYAPVRYMCLSRAVFFSDDHT